MNNDGGLLFLLKTGDEGCQRHLMCFMLSALASHVATAVDTAATRLWNVSRHTWDRVFERV